MSLLNKASLIQIPSGYKDGTLYSAKPTNGDGDFTFSRGSNLAATRVNSDGLIEKGRENLVLQSNQFDTTWTLNTATLTSGQTGYDGSSDGWKLDAAASGSYLRQVISQGGVHTLSFYAKAGTTDFVLLLTLGGGNSFFNLTTGVVATNSGLISANIESVGSGWYRCSITQNSSISDCRLYPSNSGGSSAGTVYIQDAQLELGLVATDYIETTTTTAQAGILEDMPRLDYSGGATCPSLLLEPQRTNVVNNSEYFEAADWIDQAIDTTLELVSSGAPDGGAFYRCTSGASGGGRIVDVFTGSMSGGVFSLYAKGSGSLMIDLYISGGSNATKTITLTSEWTRYDVYNSRVDSNGDASIRFYPNAVADIFGAQIEAGSYPTSYIPTYGASVTRGIDSFTKTGISRLINSQEGTFFVQMAAFTSNTGTSLISLSDGSPTNNIYIGFTSTTNQLSAVLYANGSAEAAINVFSYDVQQLNKIAISYKTNEVKLFINGSLEGTDTSATMPNANTLNEFSSDFGQGSFKLAAKLKQAIIFPTALTDAECIELTTI